MGAADSSSDESSEGERTSPSLPSDTDVLPAQRASSASTLAAAARRPSSGRVPAAAPAEADTTEQIKTVDPDEILRSMRGGEPRDPALNTAFAATLPAPEEIAPAAPAVRQSAPPAFGPVPMAHAGPGGSPSVGAMVAEARPLAAYESLASSPRLADLTALTERIVGEGARARAYGWSFAAKVQAAAADLQLTHAEAATRFGNVLDVLSGSGESSAERALASALWAHALAEAPRRAGLSHDLEARAADILWLAAHTAFDATGLLDRALGEDAGDVWTAIANRVQKADRHPTASARAEALVGCAALSASGATKARSLATELSHSVKDPILLRVLSTSDHATPEEVRLEGELVPAPKGPVATVLLAVTGLLFAIHGLRLVARLALAYRVPAEVSLSEAGLRIKTRTELLGRVVREREHVVLRTGLVRVVREVRFPRAPFYAGLLALALGSYIGVRSFVDGVRSASPSLLVVGLLVVAIGIAADFVLGTLLPGVRGRVRIAFVPRSGPTLCVANVDSKRADAALTRALAK